MSSRFILSLIAGTVCSPPRGCFVVPDVAPEGGGDGVPNGGADAVVGGRAPEGFEPDDGVGWGLGDISIGCSGL